MTWLAFGLTAMFFWAMSNLLDKYIYSRLHMPPTIGWFSGLVGVVLAIFAFFIWGIDVPNDRILALGLVSGVFYSGGMYAYIMAVKHDDVSKMIALYNFVPIMIAVLAAVFLGEVFSPKIYFAILVMVMGALLISTDVDRKIKFTKGFWFILLSAMLFSISNVMDKYLLEFTDVPSLFTMIRFGFFFTLIPFLPTAWKQGKEVYEKSHRHFLLLILSSLLGVVGFVSLYFALESGFITLVESLTAFQPLFVLMGAFVLSKFIPELYSKEVSRDKIYVRLMAVGMLMFGSFIVVFT